MPIHVDPRAAEEARKIIAEDPELPEGSAGIRVGLKGGGCAGFTYVLEMAPAAREGDKVCEDRGVRIFCDFKSYLYLNGTTLKYEDTTMRKGFIFDNPNASSTCGCGESVGF